MLYVVAAIVAVLGIEIILRMRANKLIMQSIERTATKMAEFSAAVMTAHAKLVTDLQEQINNASKAQTDALAATRSSIQKDLGQIRTSYAAIFHGFVAHADYFHRPGPSNGKVAWTTLQGCRPIAALAKMMKAEQALAEGAKVQQEQPAVPDVDAAMTPAAAPAEPTHKPELREVPKDAPPRGETKTTVIGDDVALAGAPVPQAIKAAIRARQAIQESIPDEPAKPSVGAAIVENIGGGNKVPIPTDPARNYDDYGCYLHRCVLCNEHFTGHKRRAPICRQCAQTALSTPAEAPSIPAVDAQPKG